MYEPRYFFLCYNIIIIVVIINVDGIVMVIVNINRYCGMQPNRLVNLVNYPSLPTRVSSDPWN